MLLLKGVLQKDRKMDYFLKSIVPTSGGKSIHRGPSRLFYGLHRPDIGGRYVFSPT